MDADLMRVVGSVAGIGGLGLGILLLLYREVVRARVLQRLTKVQAYRILVLMLLLVFLIALLAVLAYVGTTRESPPLTRACVSLPERFPLRTSSENRTTTIGDGDISLEHGNRW